VTLGLAVFVTLVAIVIGRIVYGRRIRRWARLKGLTLLDWRTAWFYEGLTRRSDRGITSSG
jgi:hypothetical protein